MGTLKSLLKNNRWVKQYRVHKWKKFFKRWMFTEEERRQAEKDPTAVREIVYAHIKNNKSVPANTLSDLENVIKRSGRADIPAADLDELKTDMLFCLFAYGFTFNEYVCYQFEGKSREERLAFLSDRDSLLLGYDMNDIDDMMIFSDKMNTYHKFQSSFGREAISLSSQSDYDAYVSYIGKHRQFVKKNVFQSCGRSIELIDVDADPRSEQQLFADLIAEGKVILEELVQQSSEMSAFNASSVNTVRCITLNTKNGIHIPYCFMKIGRKGAFVDNGGAGGILVGIDSKTGVMNTDGVDEYGIRYEAHPDSGVVFRGYQLPGWDQMLDMCRKLSAELDTVRLIGWDTACTDRGWIIIEGNALTEVIGPQSTSLRGIREDVEAFYKMI